MGKYVDITGQKYERLTAIRDVGSDSRKGHVWLCKCDCGNFVNVPSNKLRRKHTKSCGCLKWDLNIERSTTHGQGNKTNRTAEYRAWAAMKTRCYNPKIIHFEHYGGRGITVCDRWLNSFENFLADMGERPSSKHTLDRKEVNGNYSPENCCWATKTEQSRNQRMRKDNSSGVRGVNWNDRDKKWYSIISIDKKQKHLGVFDDKEKAIEARVNAEIEYWNKKPS